MEPIRVKIHVSAAAAIRAGKAVSGVAELAITDEQLAGLTEDQLAELATGADLGNRQDDPRVGEPTWDAVLAVLDARLQQVAERKAKEAREAAERKAKHEALIASILAEPPDKLVVQNWQEPWRRQQRDGGSEIPWGDGRLIALRSEVDRLAKERNAADSERRRRANEEREAALVAEAAEKAALEQRQCEAMETWVRTRGTDSQRERLGAGVLPPDEAWAAIRDEVFAAVDLPRYVRLTCADIQCQCCDGPDATFDTEEVETRTEQQWSEQQAIASAVSDAEITLKRHVGYCDRCDEGEDGQTERMAWHVTVDWHGRPLGRVYQAADAELPE